MIPQAATWCGVSGDKSCLPNNVNFAGARSKYTSYDIDERALARAVRADQAVHTSTPDRHVNPAQRAYATKILRQSMHRQHRLVIVAVPYRDQPVRRISA
jgi:hypothetical protein